MSNKARGEAEGFIGVVHLMLHFMYSTCGHALANAYVTGFWKTN